jgi:hypothetical protein
MSETAKKITVALIIFGGVIAFFFFIKDVSGLLATGQWTVHETGNLEFESPEELNSISFEGIAAVGLSGVRLYTDKNKVHSTWCLMANVDDSISIVNAYSAALETILVRHHIDPAVLQMDDINVDEAEMSSTFSFKLHGAPALGFGVVRLNKNKIESLWLVPVTKGFPQSHIERFKKGISPALSRSN